MSIQRPLSWMALAAAAFVFVASAQAQSNSADKPSAAASGPQAGHKRMHDMTAKEREQHHNEMHDKMHGKDGDKKAHGCKGKHGKGDHKGAAGHGKGDHCGAAKSQ